MRIRLFGHHIPSSIAALTITEAALFYSSVYGAALARFHTDWGSAAPLSELRGALWPRALLFSVVMVICLLAFGLYSARQRARVSGIALRLGVALLTGFLVTAACFYLIPNLWIG